MQRISRIMATGFPGLLGLLILNLAVHGNIETASARDIRPAALSVSTREIDLGAVGSGESARAQFQITNTGEGRIRWAIEEPPGWESSKGMGLTGECGAVAVAGRCRAELPQGTAGDGRSPGGDPDRIREETPWCLSERLPKGPTARRCGSNPMRADGPCFSSSA